MASSEDNRFIKKAGVQVTYTKQQMEELFKCMDPKTGPLYFMENFMMIQHPTRGSMLFKPHDYQKELIDCFHNHRYSIAMLGRQLGKTTVAAGYLLWYAMFVRDSYILIASKSGADALDIMSRVRFAYEGFPDHIRAGAREYNKKSILFDNGSKISSTTTTENTGRGKSLSLVYLDEFAFVDPPRVAKELWTSLSPTLSTGGKCIITSTPNSDEDQFAQIWFDAIDTTDEYGNKRANGEGKNGFGAYHATWEANKERDAEWAADEMGKIGEDRFKREHECEFIIFEETLINSLKLAKLKGIEPIRKTGQVRWFKKIDPTKTYVAALDPSMGTGGDNAAITVWELPSMRQVAEWKHNKTAIEGQMRIFREMLKEIWDNGNPEIYWSLESNSLGEAALVVIRDTGEEAFPGTFLHDPSRLLGAKQRRKGFVTTNKAKLEACSKLKEWIEADKLQIKSQNLLNELKNFVAKGNTYCARQGSHDDLTMSTILFIRMAVYISTWDDQTYDKVNSNITNMDDDDYESPTPVLVC